MSSSHRKEISLKNDHQLMMVFGNHNQNIQFLEEKYGVAITNNGLTIIVDGDKTESVDSVYQILSTIQQLIFKSIKIGLSDIVMASKMYQNNTLEYFLDFYDEVILTTKSGQDIKVKTFGQKEYIQSIKKYDIVFGIGPAGTGKTFLSVVMACKALKQGQVKKIILTRPAVEAGERLGFLPGDLKEKIDPYLRPLYDALFYIFGKEHTERLMDRGVIEIAPLAYMRGRTLDDAFVILDESQNTTPEQMKMFLTRLGYNSKLIVNGDYTQIDLPKGVTSGLLDAKNKLSDVELIKFIEFSEVDVVRHPLVGKIITAYNKS